MTVRDQSPRSHHKGSTGRVRTGNQLYPALCHCQLGQDIIYKMVMWIHQYKNSCIWIHVYRVWIHIWIQKYMKSEIRIHSIKSEFMIQISWIWIYNMNSLLKIWDNSIFWIHGIEFFRLPFQLQEASAAIDQPTTQHYPSTSTTPKTLHSTLPCWKRYFGMCFWVLDVAGWQSMDMMAHNNTARNEDMTTAKFPAFPASLTGPALNECLKISKTFIAYLKSLLALRD